MYSLLFLLLALGGDARRIRQRQGRVADSKLNLKKPIDGPTLWKWLVLEADLQQDARSNSAYALHGVRPIPSEDAVRRVEFLEYMLFGGDPGSTFTTYSFSEPNLTASMFKEHLYRGTIGALGFPWGPSCGQTSGMFFDFFQTAAGMQADKHGNAYQKQFTREHLDHLDRVNKSEGEVVGTSRARAFEEAKKYGAVLDPPPRVVEEFQHKGLNHINRQGLVDRLALGLPEGAALDYIRIEVSGHSFMVEKRADGTCAVYQTWDGTYGLAYGVLEHPRGRALPTGSSVTCVELSVIMSVALEGGVPGWDPATRILSHEQKVAREAAQCFIAGERAGSDNDRLRLDENRDNPHKWLLSWQALPESDVEASSLNVVERLPRLLHEAVEARVQMWADFFEPMPGNTTLEEARISLHGY